MLLLWCYCLVGGTFLQKLAEIEFPLRNYDFWLLPAALVKPFSIVARNTWF
jgi:hypothetical protein